MNIYIYIYIFNKNFKKKKQKNTEHQNMYQVLVMCTKNKIQINQSISFICLIITLISRECGMWCGRILVTTGRDTT